MAKEYIEREAALKESVEVYYWCGYEDRYGDFVPVDTIQRIPATDVAPVRHGRWIHKEGEEFSYCSTCHYPVSYMWDMTNYCPNCGVKMGDDNI